MAGCLVLIVARGGLKMLDTVWSRFGGCDKASVNPFDPRLPDGDYDTVYIIDSTAASGATMLSVAARAREKYRGARILLAAVPKTDLARAILDIPLEPPRRPAEGKVMVTISGFPGVGKTAFAYSVSVLNNACLYKWGKLIATHFDVGRYGERLAEMEERDPYYTVIHLYPALKRLVEQCSSNLLVFDGVKTIEQIVGLTYSLGVTPIPLFTDVRDKNLRRVILESRGMPDDWYVKERDAMLCKLGLCDLERVAVKVYLDAKTVEEAVPDERVRRLLDRVIGLGRMTIRGRFNPYGNKLHILYNLYTMLRKADQSKPTVLDAAEEIVSRLEKEGYVHRGYVKRLEKRLGRRLPEWIEKLIVYTATGFRLIDDILDEHPVRWMSEEGRLVESPWWKYSIHHAVVWGNTLTLAAARLALEHGKLDVFRKWVKRVLDGVKRELELEETRRRPTIEDWVTSAEREAAYRAMLAELLGEDWREWYIDGMVAQLKDDLNPSKGGREDTDYRLNRPIAPRVFRNPHAVLEALRELKKRVKTLVPREATPEAIEALRKLVLEAAATADKTRIPQPA